MIKPTFYDVAVRRRCCPWLPFPRRVVSSLRAAGDPCDQRRRDFPNVAAGRVAATFHQGQELHGAALILALRPSDLEGQRWIPPSGDRFAVFGQAG